MKFPYLKPPLALVVRFAPSSLSLMLTRDGRVEKVEHLTIREMPAETLQRAVADFADPASCEEVLVILPRSEVLHKEFSLARGPEEDVRRELNEKIQALLPFSMQEMAWGLRVEPDGQKLEGVLMAAPEKKIREMLAFLGSAGLAVPSLDLVTEDQTLLWAFLASGERRPSLVLENSAGRVLALFVKDGRMIFSRAFAAERIEEEVLPELSLVLIENGGQPEKILISGDWGAEGAAVLSAHFSKVVTLLPRVDGTAAGASLPASLYGACCFDGAPRISLLPREEKLLRKQRERRRLVRDLGRMTLFLCVMFALGSGFRLLGMDFAQSRVTRQLDLIMKPAGEASGRLELLRRMRAGHESKDTLLLFLGDMAGRIPQDIQLRELRIEQDRFLFSGLSPSYGKVSQTVEGFDRSGFLKAVKLRNTRSRREQGTDSLEFEVEGQWIA